jgi:kumamolisin
MRKAIVMAIVVFSVGSLLSAQAPSVIPESSIEKPEDIGVRAHTTYFIYAPKGVVEPQANPGGETPASLACVYNLVSHPTSGCPISSTTALPTGGGGVIVLVDAYDDPSAATDLKAFSKEFGLPAPNFKVEYANGKPSNGCSNGWELEESLDVQWAHAMAPKAQVVLMEAASNSFSDLFDAITAANSYIADHGGKGDVSMSWGGSEFSSEASDDSYFTQSGVVYFASTGDSAGVLYPSTSANVVAAGATQVNRNGSGDYTGQVASKSCDPTNHGCGGGKSAYETRPSFQDNVLSVVGTHRGVPDLAFDSSSKSAVAVYNSSCYGGWIEVYGTSVASPSLAGIINSAGTFHKGSNAENTEIYKNMSNTSDFTDITSGSCGSLSAKKGYDLCTGVGVDNGKKGK